MINETLLHDARSLLRQQQHLFEVQEDADARHSLNILSFQATPEEVKEWYYAADPVDSNYYLGLEIAKNTEDMQALVDMQKQTLDQDLVMGRGGLILLAHNLFPDAFDEDNPKGWFESLYEKHYVPGVGEGLVDAADYLTARGLLDLCFAHIYKHGMKLQPPEALEDIFIAAEMLRISTSSLYQGLALEAITPAEESELEEVADDLRSRNKPSTILAGISREEFDKLIHRQNVISDGLLRYVGVYATAEWPPEFPDEMFDDVRMLGLRAQLHLASSWMSDNFANPERYERSKFEFASLVDTMQYMFQKGNEINKRLKTPALKGPMHEVLWYLDAYVLRMSEPDTFGNVRAFPAYSRGDAPKIGHPEQKRGVDMTVAHEDKTDFLQLKSSPKKAKQRQGQNDESFIEQLPEEMREYRYAGNDEYHPMIWLLHEPNFMEVDPRRLSAKLRAYAEWAEGGFDTAEAAKVVKYVMSSVKWEFENIVSRNSDRGRLLHRQLAALVTNPERAFSAGQPMNREQRRRQAKAERRSAQKKKR